MPEGHPWLAHLTFAKPLIETETLVTLTEEWRRSRDPDTWLQKQVELTAVVIDSRTLDQVEAKLRERLQLEIAT